MSVSSLLAAALWQASLPATPAPDLSWLAGYWLDCSGGRVASSKIARLPKATGGESGRTPGMGGNRRRRRSKEPPNDTSSTSACPRLGQPSASASMYLSVW